MQKEKVSFSWALKEYVWPRKKLVAIGLILILIKSISGLAIPYATKRLVDDIVPNKDLNTLYLILTSVVIALLLNALSSFSLTRLLSVEAQHLISLLRAKVQKKLLALPIIYFDNNKSGALVSRVMSDVEVVRNIV